MHIADTTILRVCGVCVANNTNMRDCIVGNGHILQWDLMSKINIFAELRQKICLHIHVVVFLTSLPS